MRQDHGRSLHHRLFKLGDVLGCRWIEVLELAENAVKDRLPCLGQDILEQLPHFRQDVLACLSGVTHETLDGTPYLSEVELVSWQTGERHQFADFALALKHGTEMRSRPIIRTGLTIAEWAVPDSGVEIEPGLPVAAVLVPLFSVTVVSTHARN